MEKWSIKYIPFGLLCAYLIKSLVNGAGLNEVLLIGILASLTAFYEQKLSRKKIIELQTQLNQLIEHNKIQDKSIDDLKSSVVSVKVSTGIRGLGSK